MASPPWEPYPEQRRKLEQRRARRSQPKDPLVSSGAKKSITVKTVLESLVSPTPSVTKITDAQDEGKSGDGGGGGYFRHIQDRDDEHNLTPLRPENCRCSREGGCGNKGGCCRMEGSSEGLSCPCNLREISAKSEIMPEMESCGVCMEDGKLRDCCKRYYCKLCYESTGNCPGCQRLTVGANLTLLVKAKLLSAKFKGNENEAHEEVRDGEECRSCLRQGFFRKCCGEFYCSDCYFKSGHCPSCQVKTERSVKYQRVPPDPGLVPVLVGYVATLVVCLAVLTCIALLVASYQSHIETVFRQKCFGFFPTCSAEPTCVAFEGDVAHGLNPLTKWNSCEDESTISKVYGRFCVFDRQVNVLSDGKWGYDFCEHDFVTPTAGVYVFEDTFELWAGSDASSNTMASARWDHVTNGGLSGVCGVDSGDRALVFTGANHREAETLDVDMRYGGKVAFSLKMGPSASDPASVACKPTFGGNVYLYYSLDSGSSWEILTILQTYLYRQEEFMKVEVDVPSSLNADGVRFLWRQENFENAFEYWALDDVISYFPDDWDQSEAFIASVETEVETLREIRCCFQSEQCDLGNERQGALDCSKYAAEMSDKRALMGAELFVVLGALVALAKSLYRTVEAIVVQGWVFIIPEALRTRPPKIFMADDPVPGAMNKVFGLDVDTRWQRRFLLFVCLPLLICWLYCAALLRNFYLVEEITLLPEVAPTRIKLKAHISGLFLLATFADFHAAFVVAKDVVCVLPVWIPQIDVDLRPAAGWLRIGDKKIMLEDIKDTGMFSQRYCECLAAGYIAGVMPWNLVALIFKYSYSPYGVSRYTTTCLGAVLVLRAFLGADWVLKLAYATRWLLTVDMYKRDDIGNAFISDKTKHLVCHCAIWGTLISMGFMCLFNMKKFWIASAAAFGAFAFYGLGLSVVQGLPLTPRILLTTISRGVLIRVHRRVLCPCDWFMNKCGEMHSRDELLCVFVKDSLTFSEMLRGDDTLG